MSPSFEAAVPGWYGKLPGLGDFVTRRLPPEFVRPWDAWLQEGLAAAQADLGERWIDCYLTAPIWRFVLLPDVIESCGWAGIMMPSVDRVGRQFPLTVAITLPSYAAAAEAVFEEAGWFAGLEAEALAALDVTRDADDLERSLGKHPFAALVVPDSTGDIRGLQRLRSIDDFGRTLRAYAFRDWSARAGWKSLWWTRGRVDDHPLALASGGLPTLPEFCALLRARSGETSPDADGILSELLSRTEPRPQS